MIAESIRDRFVEYSFQQLVHPLVHTVFSPEQVRAHLSEELSAHVQQGNSDEFALSFKEHCPVSGTTAEDYKLRHVEPESGFHLLAGIRFRGLDLGQPFVAIVERTRSFTDETHLQSIMKSLQDEFAVFAPKSVLFYQSSHNEGFVLPEQAIDKRILMGTLASIANTKSSGSVVLEPATTLDFYDRYYEEYSVVTRRSPDYFRSETAELAADMQRYIDKDITFKVFIEGEFAGVFIVSLETAYGAQGYYVIENLLFEQFRGKGLGPYVQHAVATELRPHQGTVLFGSIYPSNLPSYRSALRSQRVDIGGHYLVPFS